MIDKYKRSRVQRAVPWRGPAPRYCVLTMEAFQRAVRSVRMHTPEAQDALVSGAMPTEFNPQDLRSL